MDMSILDNTWSDLMLTVI